MMFKAPSDRAAVPERPREGFPLFKILFLTTIITGLLYLVPTLDHLAEAGISLSASLEKSKSCEDTAKPVTRRAVR